MLRPLCPTVVIGAGEVGQELAETLDALGAPLVGCGRARDLPSLLQAHRPVALLIDARASLGELEAALAGLARRPSQQRPITLALVASSLVADLQPEPGLDDFVVWPCTAAELEVRLRLARWRKLGLSGEGLLRSGELCVDVRHHRVLVGGREVALTLREYELLRALLQARGRVLTRESLLAQVWGPDYLGGQRTVDLHIHRLRFKLPEVADRILTVRGVGYRLAPAGEEPRR
jgi:DNA-binding response OmpR family regulator